MYPPYFEWAILTEQVSPLKNIKIQKYNMV